MPLKNEDFAVHKIPLNSSKLGYKTHVKKLSWGYFFIHIQEFRAIFFSVLATRMLLHILACVVMLKFVFKRT